MGFRTHPNAYSPVPRRMYQKFKLSVAILARWGFNSRGAAQSSGRSPEGAIFTSRGMNLPTGLTRLFWAAMTSSISL